MTIIMIKWKGQGWYDLAFLPKCQHMALAHEICRYNGDAIILVISSQVGYNLALKRVYLFIFNSY